MNGYNNKIVKLSLDGVLDEGWVGLDNLGNAHFKPSRGSGGFALYSTEKLCLRNSGCLKAMRVTLNLKASNG